jgi:hypothetical protein
MIALVFLSGGVADAQVRVSITNKTYTLEQHGIDA